MNTTTDNDIDLNLNPPAPIVAPGPVKNVTPEQANNNIKLTEADHVSIQKTVDAEVENLLNLDVHSDAFQQNLQRIANVAQDDIRASAAASSRLLDKPVRSMQNGNISEASPIGKNLLSLRRQMEKLDPAKSDLKGGLKKKLLGIIPFGGGNKIEDYMNSYQSSKTQIDDIVTSLYRGKDEILRDNASIEEEKANIWNQMIKLRKYAEFTEKLDDALSAKIETLKQTDPERAKIMQEEVLYSLRQRRQDIMTQAAVNTQGYMSMDLVRRNNQEMALAIERTTTTTMSALRTAVITAQALSTQKDVIEMVKGVNETTNSMILSTSKMLAQNANDIASISSSPTIKIETLQKSFDNVFAAMDTADTYRIKALESMKQTVDGLKTQIDRSNTYLDKNRQDAISSTNAQPMLTAIKID